MDKNQANDWEIVKLANKNPDHFKYIVKRYQGPIYRYLKRMSYYGHEDVEDMLQEIFLKVYRNMNDFDSTDKFSSLIYRIAHNHLVDCIRKSSCRYDQNSLRSEEVINLVRSEVNVEKEIINQETMEEIKSAIAKLPVSYREVLILKFLEEKKISEMVDILRKPQGTVATLLRRGRKMLKENLERSGIKI